MNALGLLLRVTIRGQMECIRDRLKTVASKFTTKVSAYPILITYSLWKSSFLENIKHFCSLSDIIEIIIIAHQIPINYGQEGRIIPLFTFSTLFLLFFPHFAAFTWFLSSSLSIYGWHLKRRKRLCVVCICLNLFSVFATILPLMTYFFKHIIFFILMWYIRRFFTFATLDN